jgi:nucleotide-sensitive chloride channel 1A
MIYYGIYPHALTPEPCAGRAYRPCVEGGFPRECIYTQVEGPAPEGYVGGGAAAAVAGGADGTNRVSGGGEQGDEDGDDEEEEEEEDFGGDFDEMTELRLVPDNPAQLEAMFKTLCECAAMNPDDGDEDGEDGGDGAGGDGVGGGGGAGEFYFNEEEVLSGAGAEARAAMLDHYDSLLQMPTAGELDELIQNDPGRFEDDDEEDEEA